MINWSRVRKEDHHSNGTHTIFFIVNPVQIFGGSRYSMPLSIPSSSFRSLFLPMAGVIPLLLLLPIADGIRIRRQAFPPNPSVYEPRVEDYNLPPFYQPHPGRDASSLTPIFPFTSEFNNGLDINPGTRVTVDGNLNAPILGWGIWDFKGGVKVGRPNTRVGFGSLNRPTNNLGISPETIAALGNDKIFNEAREKVPSIPVSVLPGNFVPIRCKPPFCNPFLHNLAFGVDVEPGDDYLFDAGFDFPIPLGPAGVGVRFPISGAVNVGTDPLLITYGHGMGPVEPPGFRKKDGSEMFAGRKRRLKDPREMNDLPFAKLKV